MFVKRIAVRIELDVVHLEGWNGSAKYNICSLQYVCKCERKVNVEVNVDLLIEGRISCF